MTKRLFVTGDTHRVFQRIYDFFPNHEENKDIALIILGDAGILYENNQADINLLKKLQATNLTFYCLRGNHEMRPADYPGIQVAFDEFTNQYVYRYPAAPNVNFLIDGLVYTIKDYTFLALGGAYSVDKWYRLMSNRRWFANEQLNIDERSEIESKYANCHLDYILSHTCPYSWQPTDLFLRGLDQSTVDNSMELWMDYFKNLITYDHWYWGHYHDDRVYSVETDRQMFYQLIKEIEL